ncbi:MAG: peptidoglycan editing factor PgeF [Thalassotalea sp.]
MAISTTRHAFVAQPSSQNPYNDFNLGLHVGDDNKQVLKNRHNLSQVLPSNTQIQWLEQVHGSDVHIAKTVSVLPVTADAAYSQAHNIALAIMTADCLPILVSSANGEEIAAIHGGWRPIAQNIIHKTLQHFNSKPEQLVAWLGPCIGATAFEVGQDVYDIFIAINKQFSSAFIPAKHSSHYYCDLAFIAKLQLRQLGVTKIIENNDCTFNNPEHYFSYRRDNITGRMASVICRL